MCTAPPRTACLYRRALGEQYGWDLRRWRRAVEKRGGDKGLAEGFAAMDAGGGDGWDLLCSLIQ